MRLSAKQMSANAMLWIRTVVILSSFIAWYLRDATRTRMLPGGRCCQVLEAGCKGVRKVEVLSGSRSRL